MGRLVIKLAPRPNWFCSMKSASKKTLWNLSADIQRDWNSGQDSFCFLEPMVVSDGLSNPGKISYSK